MAEMQAELEHKNSSLAAQLVALKEESALLRPQVRRRSPLGSKSKRLPLDRRDSNTQEAFGLHAKTMTLGNLPALEDRGEVEQKHTSFAQSGNIPLDNEDADVTADVAASCEKDQDQHLSQQEDHTEQDRELEEWLIRELGVTSLAGSSYE